MDFQETKLTSSCRYSSKATILTRGSLMTTLRSFMNMLVISLACLPAFGKDTVNWLEFEYPPAYFTTGPMAGKGFNQFELDYLIAHLPEYLHTRTVLPLVRALVTLKRNSDPDVIYAIAGQGQSPSAESEVYQFYTKPLLGITPMGISFRTKDAQMFNGDKSVSLESLLKNPTLKFGYLPFEQTGAPPVIIDLVKKYKDNAAKSNVAGDPVILMRMLAAGRFDYTIDWGFTFPTTIQTLQLKDSISYKRITELPPFIPVYGIVSKTPKGKILLQKINTIIASHEFKKAVIDYSAQFFPENQQVEFRKFNHKTIGQ